MPIPTFRSPLYQRVYEILNSHIEITAGSMADKIEADPEWSDIRANYNTKQQWRDAVNKILHYLKKNGYASCQCDTTGVTQWSPLTPPEPAEIEQPSEALQIIEAVAAEMADDYQAESDSDACLLEEAEIDAAESYRKYWEEILADPIDMQGVTLSHIRLWTNICDTLSEQPVIRQEIRNELIELAAYLNDIGRTL